MTITRSDQKRLGASLAILGTILEDRGETAWDRFAGWQDNGPNRPAGDAPDEVCTCGHSIDSHDGLCLATGDERPCWCTEFTPAAKGTGPEDRSTQRKQASRAAEHFAEHRADLNELDRLVQRMLRRIDIACPPNLSQIQNRRDRLAEPVTPADAAIEGMCKSCWRDSEYRQEIETNSKGLRYYKDYCRWCGGAKAEYGIEPPLEILRLHHETPPRRISPEDFQAAVDKVLAASQSSKKKGKKKKGKSGWKAA